MNNAVELRKKILKEAYVNGIENLEGLIEKRLKLKKILLIMFLKN